jgi:hypothetical protein
VALLLVATEYLRAAGCLVPAAMATLTVCGVSHQTRPVPNAPVPDTRHSCWSPVLGVSVGLNPSGPASGKHRLGALARFTAHNLVRPADWPTMPVNPGRFPSLRGTGSSKPTQSSMYRRRSTVIVGCEISDQYP